MIRVSNILRRNRASAHSWMIALAAFASRDISVFALNPTRQALANSSSYFLAGQFRLQQCKRTRTPLYSSWARSEAEKLMTDDALAIVKEAIRAVDPYAAIRSHVRFNSNSNELAVGGSKYRLENFDSLILVAFGKASSAMATAVVHLFEEGCNLPIEGVIVVKDGHGTKAERELLESHNIKFLEASHPVPDARSAEAAREIMSLVSGTADNRSLVISCISGGGSALFCLPQDPLTLDDLQATNSVLLASGLDIKDVNVIRKRLENGKGGRLAAAAYPSTVASLVLSDVLGDPLDLIASGPTVPDSSSWKDAWRLVEKNNLQGKLPQVVVNMLKDGAKGSLSDSPTVEHPAFSEGLCETVVVGNNELAVNAAAAEARRRGYDVKVLGTRVEGEAKHASNFYAAMAQQLSLQQGGSKHPFSLAQLPAALIAGGETTVSIQPDSDGKGGRNQELALAAALEFQELGLRDVVLASVGTDGTDGPTDAAGAVVDGGSLGRLEGNAEDALRRHDAYTYLDQTDEDNHTSLIKTGPTGTNVADVCVVLVR